MSQQARPKSRLSIRTYATGDVLVGKYVLEKLLGEGGMGTVWLARNVTLDAPVALKLIRPELDLDEASDRLLKEARATAKIEHRAIVRVFDFGETEERDPFIVMELLEGTSLDDMLDERGRISPIEIGQILLPVIDGLARAHEEGIVHRDLKPSNIFLAREGKRIQPKVVDFGIAKLDRYDTLPKLTRQGTVLGSPSYMAPEQARGLEDVDHRADIWTVCVVLYEAVTGCAAFQGSNYNAVLRGVIEDPVTPLAEHGVDDPLLAEIVARGLAKDREDRFPTMQALGVALANWLSLKGVLEDVCGESIEENWSLEPDASDLDGEFDAPSSPAGGFPGSSGPPSSDPLMLVQRKTPPEPFREAEWASSKISIPPSGPDEDSASVGLVSATSRATRRSGLSVAMATMLGLCLFAGAFGTVRRLRPSSHAGAAKAVPLPSVPAPQIGVEQSARRPGDVAVVPWAPTRRTTGSATATATRSTVPSKRDEQKPSAVFSTTPSIANSAASRGIDLKEPY